MTPETAKILMDGLKIVAPLGVMVLCFYIYIKGLYGGYSKGG